MKKRPWKTSEVRTIQNGEIPEGRTYHAVQQFCSRTGMKFPGKRFASKNPNPNETRCLNCKTRCRKINRVKGGFLCKECMIKTLDKRIFIEKTLENFKKESKNVQHSHD